MAPIFPTPEGEHTSLLDNWLSATVEYDFFALLSLENHDMLIANAWDFFSREFCRVFILEKLLLCADSAFS